MFTGRVVGPTDPQWLETDRGYALAWRTDRAATCSCGTRLDEWDEDDDAYISDHVYCEGCARLADEQSNVPEDADGQPRPGFHVFLTPREVYEAQHADGPHIDDD